MGDPEELHKITGPALILAGPGTGKTECLAKRVKYLVDEMQVDHREVTVITFTVAAAANMRDRISDRTKKDVFIQEHRQPKMICTMHSLGNRIVREKSAELGFSEKPHVVYSDTLRDILIGDAAQLAGFKREVGELTKECRKFGACTYVDEPKCRICQQYREVLDRCNAIDLDDQIICACKLLEEDASLSAKYQCCCKHLLVDEYQDINEGQFRLIFKLSANSRTGLFVVGDDDQSIYSWRGGSPTYIRKFTGHYGDDAAVRSMSISFRCSKNILAAATTIVAKYDRNRSKKDELEYKNQSEEKVHIHSAASDIKEAKEIRRIIDQSHEAAEILVLIPHRGFLRALSNELRNEGIRYVGPLVPLGEGFPLVAVLGQWLSDNTDSLALRECMQAYIDNSDVSGVPSARSRRADKKAEREGAFLEISQLWKAINGNDIMCLWNALVQYRSSTKLLNACHEAFSNMSELHGDSKRLAEFASAVVRVLCPWSSTGSFLEEIDSLLETSRHIDISAPNPRVRIMTFQGAKGLQAPVVCVVGLEEGTIPRKPPVIGEHNEEKLAESSRLMYVTMTRASQSLHLFYSRTRSGSVVYRNIYKTGAPPDLERTRFIKDLPECYVDTHFHK